MKEPSSAMFNPYCLGGANSLPALNDEPLLTLCWQWQGVCHRDLKLENTLLDGRPAPRLKICDFGYSKVVLTDFQIHAPKVVPNHPPRMLCISQHIAKKGERKTFLENGFHIFSVNSCTVSRPIGFRCKKVAGIDGERCV